MTQSLLFDRPERRAGRRRVAERWPPPEYELPDTIEEIERGRPAGRSPPPEAAPAVRGSDTSEAAAEAVAPRTGKLRELVLYYIRRQGPRGATDPEIAEGLGMLSDTARARRCELRDRGLIVDSGERRDTPRGRSAVVWVARD